MAKAKIEEMTLTLNKTLDNGHFSWTTKNGNETIVGVDGDTAASAIALVRAFASDLSVEFDSTNVEFVITGTLE